MKTQHAKQHPSTLIMVVGLVFALFNFCVVETIFAQQPHNPTVGLMVARMLQERDSGTEIPEDYVALVSNNNLRVRIPGYAQLDDKPADAVATLVKADGTKIEAKPDADGNLNFENVGEGLASLLLATGGRNYGALAVYLLTAPPSIPSQPDVSDKQPPTAEPAPTAEPEAYEFHIGLIDPDRFDKTLRRQVHLQKDRA